MSIYFKDENLGFIRNTKDLINRLNLSQKDLSTIDINSQYSLLLTEKFLSKINPLDIKDPLLTQILPLKIEENINIQSCGNTNPLSEDKFRVCEGVLKKYDSRVLIHTVDRCFGNCRFCFRRYTRFSMKDNISSNEYLSWWDKVISFISKDTSIKEVILSGGDPLVLSNEILDQILFKLSKISHLKIIRFHTRSVVFYPDRINDELLEILDKYNNKDKKIVFVFHINHKNECSDSIKKLSESFMSYSQTVLLKGVNDSKEVLSDLFYELIRLNVTPYYLHSLDSVKGAMHFKVELNDGKILMKELKNSHPGYMIPLYVQELVNEKSKTQIM